MKFALSLLLRFTAVSGQDNIDVLQMTTSPSSITHNSSLKGRVLLNKRDNMCVGGHIVPELFLIGAQKASTTLLASALTLSPQLQYGPTFDNDGSEASQGKESHVFDNDEHEKGVEWWAHHYPRCEDAKGRLVTFDATPNYLSSGSDVLHSFYQGMTTKLKFLVVLREPFARLQSWFYHATAPNGWMEYKGSFLDYTHQILDGKEVSPELVDGVLCSEYASGLVKWIHAGFEPSQFTIMNMVDITTPSSLQRVSSDIWQQLGVEEGHNIQHDVMNEHEHPSPEKEVPRDIQLRLEAHMVAQMNQTISQFMPSVLGQTLAATHIGLTAAVLAQGFHLYGFQESLYPSYLADVGNPSRSRVASVIAWLTEKWA